MWLGFFHPIEWDNDEEKISKNDEWYLLKFHLSGAICQLIEKRDI